MNRPDIIALCAARARRLDDCTKVLVAGLLKATLTDVHR